MSRISPTGRYYGWHPSLPGSHPKFKLERVQSVGNLPTSIDCLI